MSDEIKYYYLKLKDSFYDRDEIKIIESLPNGYKYSNILLKLYLKSLKHKGKLMFNDRIPYNHQLIATVTGHDIDTVRSALDLFKEFELIEILDNGAIYMLDIQDFIGKSSTEADRIRIYRNQIAEEKQKAQLENVTNDVQMYEKSTTKLPITRDREREKDITKDIINNKDIIPIPKSKKASITLSSDECASIIDYYNNTCLDLPKVEKLSDTRRKLLNARFKEYGIDKIQEVFLKAHASDFLSGRIPKTGKHEKWTAYFDWLLKSDSFLKVLEGTYDNKYNSSGPTLKDIDTSDVKFSIF